MEAPVEAVVREALRSVVDPELGDDVVSLGMYRGATVAADGTVEVAIALTTAACPLRAQLRDAVVAAVSPLPGVAGVRVAVTEMSASDKRALMDRVRLKATTTPPATRLPARTRVLAVASGKGGVGKSSVTVNLAAGLAARGYAVGLLDADIAGFSVPRMLGAEGRIEATRTGEAGDRLSLVPVPCQLGPGRVEVLSMGFLSPEGEAIMWRGLMLNRAVQHFVEDAAWSDLDYLLVDLPPGTGDIQMGLARLLPRAELVVVTTPALAAAEVAARAVDMARRNHLRVLGVVENMSGFSCPHGERIDLFGTGGGDLLAERAGVPLLARIPVEASVAAGGDAGRPAVLGDGPGAASFAVLVDAVLAAAPPVVMADCSARLLEAVAGALASGAGDVP